jgi:hypothetical protein
MSLAIFFSAYYLTQIICEFKVKCLGPSTPHQLDVVNRIITRVSVARQEE